MNRDHAPDMRQMPDLIIALRRLRYRVVTEDGPGDPAERRRPYLRRDEVIAAARAWLAEQERVRHG